MIITVIRPDGTIEITNESKNGNNAIYVFE